MCTRRAVPWSEGERKKQFTLNLGIQRVFGPASHFFTTAPDDVHDCNAIRLATPSHGRNVFPAGHSPELRTAVQNQGIFEYDGGQLQCTEEALQRRVAKNPIAAAMCFERMMGAVCRNLLRLPSHNECKTSCARVQRRRGAFGQPLAFTRTTETTGRDSLHGHFIAHCGVPPGLLESVANHPALLQVVVDALDTQCRAELPDEYFVVAKFMTLLFVPKPRDAATEVPTAVASLDDFLRLARRVVMNKNLHAHCATCTHTKFGTTGCRLCRPAGHDVASSCVVEVLKAGPDDTIPSPTFQLRCTHCFADYGRGDPRAWNSIRHLNNVYAVSPGPPVDDDCEPFSFDRRVLVLELRRRLLPVQPAGTGDASHLCKLLQRARARRTPLQFAAGADGDAAAGRVLAKLIAPSQPLGVLLQQPQLARLATVLAELVASASSSAATVPNELVASASSSAANVRALLDAITAESFVCSNGLVAEHNLLLSGCTRANAHVSVLGGGAATHKVTVYINSCVGRCAGPCAIARAGPCAIAESCAALCDLLRTALAHAVSCAPRSTAGTIADTARRRRPPATSRQSATC